jgi:hypothetical protein
MALKVVKMGTYSASKWGDRWPILPPSLAQCVVEGGVSRWLVGVVGLGAELRQRPHATRGTWGASSIRLAKENARCPGLWELLPKGMLGVPELRRLFPEGAGGTKPLLCHNSQMQEEIHSCARE